jgi:hypothetical protein
MGEHRWVKSSTSNSQGNCVEVSEGGTAGLILVREFDKPNTVVITTKENFSAFVEGVRRGDFDEFAR